jgi:cell division protein FtsQ
LLLIVMVLCGAGGVWVLYGSAWVRVERVRISGTRVLDPQEVREAAAVPLDSPLMSVDTGAIAARLRERVPRIASVDVVRSWPHTIGLKVTERKPEVFLEIGGKFVEMDAKGVRFATTDRPPGGVLRLELDADRSPSLRRFGAERLRREGVRVAAGLPEEVRRDTRVIRVRSYDAISLELTGRRMVVWGSPERAAAKARALVALMKAARGARHFDVSAPSAPAASGS